jgi:hypothetical protein
MVVVNVPLRFFIVIVASGAASVFLLLFCAETACLLALAPWYCRFGPTVQRERWQASGRHDAIRAAIRPLLKTEELVGKETLEGFCFRMTFSTRIDALTRVLLRVEPNERGTSLVYEVRPHCTLALLPLGILSVMTTISWFAAMQITFLLVGLFGVGAVFATYRWIVPHDLKRYDRLRHLREALKPLGLRVCDACGYDLFSFEPDRPCPECGWREACSEMPRGTQRRHPSF